MKNRILVGALVAGTLMFGAGAAAPAMAADNLVTNGGFDATGFEANNGWFSLGQQYDGWAVTGGVGMQIWWNNPVAAPFPTGDWAGVEGQITQSIPTEAGKTYQLDYQTRAAGNSFDAGNPGWQGGSPGGVAVDGVTQGTFTTVKNPTITTHSVVFTATNSSTVLALFSTSGAVGFDSISVTEVPEENSPIMIPAIAGGLGIAALGASGIAIQRKKKPAGK